MDKSGSGQSFIYGAGEDSCEGKSGEITGGRIKRFKMVQCSHMMPNGEPGFVDMTYNTEFMRKFRKPLAASGGKRIPEIGNFLDITPQKARKLMRGAHIFVCKLCGCYQIRDKNDFPEGVP